MPERDRTEERRLIEEAKEQVPFAACEQDAPTLGLSFELASALDRLITEADTAERESEDWEARARGNLAKWQEAERERDEARKALERCAASPDRAVAQIARAALASLSSDSK